MKTRIYAAPAVKWLNSLIDASFDPDCTYYQEYMILYIFDIMSVIFTHLKLWVAVARHNSKWVKIEFSAWRFKMVKEAWHEVQKRIH